MSCFASFFAFSCLFSTCESGCLTFYQPLLFYQIFCLSQLWHRSSVLCRCFVHPENFSKIKDLLALFLNRLHPCLSFVFQVSRTPRLPLFCFVMSYHRGAHWHLWLRNPNRTLCRCHTQATLSLRRLNTPKLDLLRCSSLSFHHWTSASCVLFASLS